MNTIVSMPSALIGAFSIFLAVSACAEPKEKRQPDDGFILKQRINLEASSNGIRLSKVIGIGDSVGDFHWVITDEGKFLLPLYLKTADINAGLIYVSKKHNLFCTRGIPPNCSPMGTTIK